MMNHNDEEAAARQVAEGIKKLEEERHTELLLHKVRNVLNAAPDNGVHINEVNLTPDFMKKIEEKDAMLGGGNTEKVKELILKEAAERKAALLTQKSLATETGASIPGADKMTPEEQAAVLVAQSKAAGNFPSPNLEGGDPKVVKSAPERGIA